MVPPDPIPNSEVKRRCADGSVGLPRVRVGHRQVLNVNPELKSLGFFVYGFLLRIGGMDGTRTRDPLRDRQVF